MATKTKRPTKGTAEPKKEAPKYSYEFLDMLADTAFTTAMAHLRKTKASKDVIRLLDIAGVLMVEQMHLMGGYAHENDSLPEYVADAVQSISALGGEWHGPTGTVTPLKELLAFWEKQKGK